MYYEERVRARVESFAYDITEVWVQSTQSCFCFLAVLRQLSTPT